MKSTLVLVLGFAFIGWMLHRDMRWRRLPSSALWIPAIWTAQASSRQVSFWFAQVGIGGEQTSRLEGSPVNVIFNGILFLAAILILARRRFSWGEFVQSNKALSIAYAFFFCSMLWSPFPVPTAKRAVLDFGCVLAALVILTEKDPAAALRVVFVRVSYILFPLSVVFMRYFPEIGRVYSSVSGTQMPCGVTGHKNLLGQMTLVFCLVLLWDLIETWRHKTPAGAVPERWVRLVNLGIGLYLLVISSSATSGMTFLLGLALLAAGARLARTRSAGRLFMAGALALVALFAADQMAGVSTRLSESLGRGAGLSGRTDIWRVTLEKYTGSVWLGAGFRAFWETAEGESVWKELSTNPLVQSHNGYLETYLNGGLVGLSLLGAFLWASGLNATDKLVRGNSVGRLAVVFWPILLLVNVTEAQFFQISTLWSTTLLVVIATPWQDRRAEEGEHLGEGRHRAAATRSIRRAARDHVRYRSLEGSSQDGAKNAQARTPRSPGYSRERE